MYNMYINYIFSFFDTDNDILFPLLFVVFGCLAFIINVTLLCLLVFYCSVLNLIVNIYIKTCMYDF